MKAINTAGSENYFEQSCVTRGENWSRRHELNTRPTDYKSVALPTELRRLYKGLQLNVTDESLVTP